ncbi:flagellar filament capping protein FliD [Alicyclobacillus fodiniaquatilis]|uniref:Flagellar hook-associated protein 2 n=1 Tax=Alicyclobacillus fodiniaquatilis TaxID=1661150 RepID=A0ABW4JP58_9BACL
MSGWLPTLSSTLQTELTNLEGSNSYVASGVTTAASSIYNTSIDEATPIVSQESSLNTTVSSLQSLSSALTTLQSAIQTLGTQSTWSSVNATSSNTDSLTISTSSGAPQTSVSFNVNNLAQGQISILSGATSTSDSAATSVNSGTMQITGGLGTASIQVNAGDSLDTIAQNINSQSLSTGVQSSIVDDQGTYELMLTSTQIGASKGSFTVDGGTTGVSLPSTNVQDAEDASLTLGGSNGVTITSPNNTFQDALPNTTMTAVSTGSGTLSIQADSSGATTAMNSFFSAYNAVESMVYQGGSAASTTIGQLIANQLPETIDQSVSSDSDSMFQTLSQIGVIVNPGSYTENQGNFTSNGAPSIGFESSNGISGLSLPAGVSLPDGTTTFTNAVSNHLSDLQSFLGVTSSGLNLPGSSFLGQLSSTISTWQQDLNGTTTSDGTITGEIGTLQNQIGSGSSAAPGTITYSLNQLQQQYTDQITNLLQQWSAANSSVVQADTQYSELAAVEEAYSSQVTNDASLYGG